MKTKTDGSRFSIARARAWLAAALTLGCVAAAQAQPEVMGVYSPEAPNTNPQTYQAGDDVFIVIVFNEDITVTAAPDGSLPTLTLSLAPNNTRATFLYAAGTELGMLYTVRPGDYTAKLNYPSAFTSLNPNGATIQGTSGTWTMSQGIPAPTSPQALGQTSSIEIRTMSLSGPATVPDGETVNLTVSRGGNFADSLSVGMHYPPELTGPDSVTIPAGSSTTTVPVTGVLPSGAPVEVRARGLNYPSDGSGDAIHLIEVTGVPPQLLLTGGVTQLSEGAGGDYPASSSWTLQRIGTGSTSGDLTVSLTFTDNSPGTDAIAIPSSLVIPNTQSEINFIVEGRDGDFTAQVTASAPGYVDANRTVTVQNVDPVITGASVSPENPTVGEAVRASFRATDVLADRPSLQGRWEWGDGSPPTVGVPSGTDVTHTYTQAGIYEITLIVTDKDGGEDERTFTVDVSDGYNLTVQTRGAGYDGLANVGTGDIQLDPPPAVINVSTPTTLSVQYRQNQTSVLITALPHQPDGDGFNNYVYQITGDGLTEADQEPLAAGSAASSVTVQCQMGQGRTVHVLFSREWRQGDGRGDVDGDGLTDEWELRWELDPLSAAGNDGGGGAPSGDRMPNAPNVILDPLDLDPDGDPAGGPFGYPIPWSISWTGYAPVGPLFNNRLQFRGQTLDIWDADYPGTDPTVDDTSGDGLTDGWLYYFWANAVNNSNFVGRAYDPNTVTGSLVIANADIRYYFNPRHNRGLAGMDLDGDGLTVLEEYFLGTNPIDWDTDGDGMPDGWEVLYGLNPLDRRDAAQNPDGDFMADDGEGRIHHDVYEHYGFDPRTGWSERIFQPSMSWSSDLSPHTRPYNSIDEFLVMRWHMDRGAVSSIPASDWLDWSTDPLSADSDNDGMPDGWELYVGLNPNDARDASRNPDDDRLTNQQEFSCWGAEALNAELFPMFDPGWLNKFWPTDPFNPDTDGDQIMDGYERTLFRYDIEGITGTPVYRGNEIVAYAGGGLNPTSVDTDRDGLPDYWEAYFGGSGAGRGPLADGTRDGMDGTWQDAHEDYDNDGLSNYQEYLVGAMHHFNYDKWVPGLGYGGYDPAAFFLPEDEFGPGHYGAAPHEWDSAYWWGDGVRFFFQLAEPRTGIVYNITGFPTDPIYATTDPRQWDTDGDGMCDYYELFHGLNPLWSLTRDIVGKGAPPLVRDARIQPWQVGDQDADPDQDGLKNWEEALSPNRPDPQTHHTDPTPYWFTDMSYSESFVNLYYQFGSLPFYWGDGSGDWVVPPSYMFDFVSNEGYDTDNDNIADKRELNAGVSDGVTDPLNFNDPLRRNALYLDGDAAARTRGAFFHGVHALRNWTVELWVKPEQLATGSRQIIIERPVPYSESDPLPSTEFVRRNFRLGLNEDGALFVEYDNDGNDLLEENPEAITELETIQAQSPAGLLMAGEWVHVAGVYDGEAEQLRLYVNGKLEGTAHSKLLPATGVTYGSVNVYRTAPIVVGAADAAPYGVVSGSPRYYNHGVLPPRPQPSLHSFFKGWIDEIRIWNGARSGTQINAAMDQRMFMADVQANQPALMYHYNFSSLPDPNYEPVAPAGFDSLNGRPADGSYPGIPWWQQAADRSAVYDNYLYVPWIQNMVAHLPLDSPLDSVYWGESSTGGEPETNRFPNSANPFNHGYSHSTSILSERNPELGEPIVSGGFSPAVHRLYNDLLPLRNARTDQDVDLWDGFGPGTSLDYDSSGDGMPDWWKRAFGLDPYSSEGIDGPWGDPDRDGLPNWAEYLAWYQFGLFLDPFDYDTFNDGWSDYDSRPHAMSPTFGQLYDDWDGLPGLWEIQHGLNPHAYEAHFDHDGDGWSNYAEFMAGTHPNDPNSVPMPALVLAVAYDGDAQNGQLVVESYTTPKMDRAPDARFVEAIPAGTVFPFAFSSDQPQSGHMREGRNWFFVYLDVEGTGDWSQGDPATVFAADLSWSTLEADVTLRDRAFGFPRFGWAPVNAEYRDVSIQLGTGPTIFAKRLRGPRHHLHEGDLLYLESTSAYYDQRHGLSVDVNTPTYNWTVTHADGQEETGSFQVAWSDPNDPPREPPAMQSPVSGIVNDARVEFRWTMDERNVAVRFEMRRDDPDTGPVVIDGIYPAPTRRRGMGDAYAYRLLPQIVGRRFIELPDGDYYWRVSTVTPGASTMFDMTPPDWAFVRLDRTSGPTGPYTIGGYLHYFGPVDHPVTVQAFIHGLSGYPVAQTTVAGPNAAYSLRGLRQGTYYLRAFMDQTQSGYPEVWETGGLLFDQGSGDLWLNHVLKPVAVGPNKSGNVIFLRDRDTDNDRLPDAWEYEQAGDLATLGVNNSTAPLWQSGPLSTTTSGTMEVSSEPLMGDSNDDGVPDLLKLYMGAQVFEEDSVGDGYSDLMRFFSLTDPVTGEVLQPFSIPSLRINPQGNPVVGWDVPEQSLALALSLGYGMVYEIQWRAALDEGAWASVAYAIPGSYSQAGRYEWTDVSEDRAGQGYYRIRARIRERLYATTE